MRISINIIFAYKMTKKSLKNWNCEKEKGKGEIRSNFPISPSSFFRIRSPY